MVIIENMQDSIIISCLIGFLAFIGRELYKKNDCIIKITQELKDLKDDFKEFIKEYRDNHK